MSKAILARNFTLRFGTVFVERTSGLILAPLLIANIGMAGYGYYGLAAGILAAYANVLSLRLPMAMIRFYPDRRDRSGDILAAGILFWIALATLSVLLIAAAPETLRRITFGGDDTGNLLSLVIGVALLKVLYEFVSFTLRAENRFELISIVDAGERVVFVVLCVVAILVGRPSINDIMALLAITSAIKVTAIWRPSCKGVTLRWPSRNLVQQMISFCLPFLPHLAGIWLIQRGAFFQLAKYDDATAIGRLTLAFTLGALLLSVTSALQATLYPMIRKYYDENQLRRVRDLIEVGLRFAITVGVFGVISLVLGTKYLLQLFGIDAGTLSSALVFILAFAFFCGTIRQIIINVLHISHTTRKLVWISPLGAGASLISGWLLISTWGATGAAISIALGTFVQTIAIYCVSPKQCLELPGRTFFQGLATAAVAAIMIQYVSGLLGNAFYWIGLIASAVAYVGILQRRGGLSSSEREQIIDRIKRFRSDISPNGL